VFIFGLTVPLTSDLACHTSSAQFATVLLLSFLLLSGAWLQGGDQKEGLTRTQRKVVVLSHQIVSYIKCSALKSVDTRSRYERLSHPQPSVDSNTSTISVEQGRLKESVPISQHLTLVHWHTLSGLAKTSSSREASSSDNVRLISIRLDGR